MQACLDNPAFQLGWLTGRQVAGNSWLRAASSRLHQCCVQPKVPTRHTRRVQVIRILASGNGVEPVGSGGSNGEIENMSERVDPAIAKEKLLRIITELINDDSQIQEVERLILLLESLRVTPVTEAFTELGLAGKWKLVFSSTRTRTAGNVRIRKIGQTFDTEKKQLMNRANWSFAAKNGVGQIAADLFVVCSYKFIGPGRLEVTVEEHKIKILGSRDGKKYDMPDNLEALVKELQLALPIDFFDPSGLVDVSYMEPNFRLARFLGKRIAGVRNVFIRDSSG